MTKVELLFAGAGRPLEEARANLALLEEEHSRGEHFWRWTGRIIDDRRVLGCMLCRLTRVSAVETPTA